MYLNKEIHVFFLFQAVASIGELYPIPLQEEKSDNSMETLYGSSNCLNEVHIE